MVWQVLLTHLIQIDNTYGTNETITGNISIANSSTNLLGKGTNFNVDLKIGDSISFTNDAGSTVTYNSKYCFSNTSNLQQMLVVVMYQLAAVVTRRRAKLKILKIIYCYLNCICTTVKTLKTDYK